MQLRLVLSGDDDVDEIVLAEDDQTVVAFATVCTSTAGKAGPVCEVPCHVYLEARSGNGR